MGPLLLDAGTQNPMQSLLHTLLHDAASLDDSTIQAIADWVSRIQDWRHQGEADASVVRDCCITNLTLEDAASRLPSLLVQAQVYVSYFHVEPYVFVWDIAPEDVETYALSHLLDDESALAQLLSQLEATWGRTLLWLPVT